MDETEGIWYSLALNDAETLSSAHEKDRVLLREQLISDSSTVFDHSVDIIVPSLVDQVSRMQLDASRQERLDKIGKAVKKSGAGNEVENTSNALNSKPRKATSAKNFFATKGKDKASASSGKSSKGSSKPEKASETKSSSSKKPSASSKSNFFTTNNSGSSKSAGSNRKASTTSKVKKTVDEEEEEEEKENTSSRIKEATDYVRGELEKSKQKKKGLNDKNVGNADDFVGDEDEDDDFLQEEEERKKRIKQRQIEDRQKETKRQRQLEERKEMERKLNPPAVSVEPTKKRRKKIVQKTTLDENGYLHTESVSVWEEVSDDEPVVVTKPKLKPKNTKGMKQGNLMGFFKKK